MVLLMAQGFGFQQASVYIHNSIAILNNSVSANPSLHYWIYEEYYRGSGGNRQVLDAITEENQHLPPYHFIDFGLVTYSITCGLVGPQTYKV